MNRLNGSWYCDCLPSGAEEACAFYALYLNVRKALCGDPSAMKASKIADVSCGASNGHAFMSWQVKGTGSAVRKSLGIAVRALKPGSVYSAYQHCIRQIGGKPNRDNFNWAANEVLSAAKRGVMCGVIGKIKLGGANKTPKKMPTQMAVFTPN